MKESAAHLIEIEQELQLYVEAKISEDWRVIHSISNSITSSNLGSDEEILAYITRERDIWNVTNITLYTQNGYSVSVNGDILTNDAASETISHAKKFGEYLTIKNSDINYIVPIDTHVEYKNSRIEAISVVRNLSSFLYNMNISSFEGSAFLYLTQNNGAVVSKLTHTDSENVYNLYSLLKQGIIRPLSDKVYSIDDMLTSTNCAVFLRELPEGNQYIVTAPIKTGYDQMRLFYFVPVKVVNQTTDSFSRYILRLSIVVILFDAIAAMIVFIYIYKIRKNQFNEALVIRERMFDLLVKNSKSAFALLSTSQEKPVFISSNAEKIIGEKYYTLEKTTTGYRMKNVSGTDTSATRELNAQIKDWNGKREFRSGFIHNTSANIPSYFEIQIYPIEENIHGADFIAVAQDVTPLYQRQEAAAEALAMAEQANKAKSQFLSNMSHDIRTPMNAIVNMTNFAKESVGDPKRQIEYLNNLSESSAHLLRLINDVLDMSRIESGKMVIASKSFNLEAALNQITEIIRPLCNEKNQKFEVDFTQLHSLAVIGDQVKLSQILINLLSNANKFTPPNGRIRFIVENISSLRENIATIRFTVEDTGQGISQKDIQQIFDPFIQANNEQSSQMEGTGLGLSICRSYVTAMGGTIQCESELGSGAVFTVELSFQKADSTAEIHSDQTAENQMKFDGLRCLLCEDNHINQKIAVNLLQRLGFIIETANNGQEGLDKFLASRPGYYDVIYMDGQMPGMDGYQATIKIRNSKHAQAQSIPIIAITANVFTEDVEKARAAGMNGHLGKPIMALDLLETTNKVLKKEEKYHEKDI